MQNRTGVNLVLTEDGIRSLNITLGNLVADSGAKAALLVEKSGQLIAAQGETGTMDTLSLSAVIVGSFSSNKAIAGLVGESEFRRMFQQGHHHSIFMSALATNDLLAVVFSNQVNIGKIKLKVDQMMSALDAQMQAMYDSSSHVQTLPSAGPKISDLF